MLELFKLVEPFLSLMAGQRQMITEKSLKLSAEILNQLRKVITLVAMLLGSLVLFCLGMSYFIDRTLDQLDNGAFSLTPSLIFLIIFMLICLAVVLYATNKNVWTNIFKKDRDEEEAERLENQRSQREASNPIETAISLLILDIVKEREEKRKTPPTNSSEQTGA